MFLFVIEGIVVISYGFKFLGFLIIFFSNKHVLFVSGIDFREEEEEKKLLKNIKKVHDMQVVIDIIFLLY
jgi:hypothetical protein